VCLLSTWIRMNRRIGLRRLLCRREMIKDTGKELVRKQASQIQSFVSHAPSSTEIQYPRGRNRIRRPFPDLPHLLFQPRFIRRPLAQIRYIGFRQRRGNHELKVICAKPTSVESRIPIAGLKRGNSLKYRIDWVNEKKAPM